MKMTIRNARLSFPALFEPKAVQAGDKPRYSAAIILSPSDPQVAAINNAIEQAATDKWGAKAAAVLKTLRASDKTALHDGDSKAQYAGFEGNVFVSAANMTAPKVVNRDGKTPVEQHDGTIYAGCYCNFVVEFWAQDNGFGKRVNANLLGVQFVKDGEAFGGGGSKASDEDFDDLSTDEDDEGLF